MSAPLFESDELPAAIPLVVPFCSRSLPDLIQIPTDYGTRFDLPAGRFGNAGALTFVVGDLLAAWDNRWHVEGVDHYRGSINDLYTPTELVVHDIFVHREVDMTGPPEVMILDRLSQARGVHLATDDRYRMPLSSKILRVSAGPAGSRLLQYPAYSKLIEYAFERTGWAPDEFQGYRFTMTFPPVPSAVVMRSVMPEKPVDCK